uniref:Uncharacterized protein n=1 Tax=Tanacetum cinerariifolium TaxID=118510 RepID=A0A6L2MH15_TANCI|nr:hypothetical protein [Tanacetum cinerariifolium]
MPLFKMAGSRCNKFRGDKGKVILVLVIRVMLLVLEKTMQVDRQELLNATTVKTEDLDTYDSDCDDVSNAKEFLMANISNYGSDVISEHIKPTLYDGIVIFDKRVAMHVIDDEETLILEEVSRSKMFEKEKDPKAIKQTISYKPIDYVKLNQLTEDFRKRFVPQQELSAEQAFWYHMSNPSTKTSDSSPVKMEAPKELPKIRTTPDACTEAPQSGIPLRLSHFGGVIDWYQSTGYRELGPSDELDGTPTLPDGRETKNVELENSVAKLLSEDESLCKEINHVKQVFKDKFDSIKKTRVHTKEQCDSLFDKQNLKSAKNEDLKAQIQDKGIVKQTKAKQPLDNALYFAYKHAKRIQELLVYVRDTCPNAIKLSAKKVAITPKNNVKKVRLKCSTSNYGSKPTGNKKNDSISQTPSRNMKNKVESQPRKVNKKNRVVEPIHDVDVKHSLLNVNSVCATCKKSMFNGCPDCSLVSGLRMFKTYDREPLSAHELCVDLLLGSRDIISLDDMLKMSLICLLSKASKTKSWLWHRQLSHLNFGTLNKLAKDGLARGIPRLKFQKDHMCSACALGKSKKSSHQPKAKDTNQEKLYLLHMDLCGPMRMAIINGKRHFVNFMKMLASRIKHLLPALLSSTTLSKACYTQNHSLIRLRYSKTPYELMQDKKSDLSFFHVFRSLCYPTNDNDDLGKLDAKVDIGIFIGYAPVKKAFRIYNKRTRKIIETIHMTFKELIEMASEQLGSGPRLHSMTPTTSSSGLVSNPVSQQPSAVLRAVVLANSFMSASIDQGSSSNLRQIHTLFEHLGKWTKDHPIANMIEEPSLSVSTRKQLQTDTMWCYFDAFPTFVEPKNFKQAMTEPSWIDTMQEKIHEFERLQVWELVSCPDKVMLIKLKWIYKVKNDESGWLMTLAANADKPSKIFDDLMSTPIDFSAFIMNGLKIKNPTQETLLGPTIKLLKGTRTNYVELEYDFEECYKALSKKLDWENPEGDDYPFNLTKPLPLVKIGNHQKVTVDYFFNNDLKYMQGGISTMTYTTSLTKTKAAQYDLPGIKDMARNIWSPVKVAYDKHALWGISHWKDQRKNFYGYARGLESTHDVYSTKRILAVT